MNRMKLCLSDLTMWLDMFELLCSWFWLLQMRSCTYGTIELSWHKMRTWEETQTESESN